MIDLTLVPQPDGLLYALGGPTEVATDRASVRFTTQFLSMYNAASERGTVFMHALNQGRVRTNADVVTLVATAGAQIRTLQRQLVIDAVLESVDLLKLEFIDGSRLKLTVRLNTVEGSVINDIEVPT